MKPVTTLYAFTIFLSAFLLFLLEPIAARQLLPVFGGSAAVWTTCLVFFQCVLLGGYMYAHLLVGRLRPRLQVAVHSMLLPAALLTLASASNFGAGNPGLAPGWRIAGLLTRTIGLPFLVLAATSPLLQAWYAWGELGTTQLPGWGLFALSNSGSLLALLVYPALVEPVFRLRAQSEIWGWGFFVFAVCCGVLTLRRLRLPDLRAGGLLDCEGNYRAVAAASANRILLWILLPACGSMLLCSVTSHIGQNIAAIPLLWVIPLAAYLLSFVMAFASERSYPRWTAVRMLALVLATFAYLLPMNRTSVPLQISIPVYALAVFFGCLFCHGELFRLRPGAAGLTRFYLMLSLGSALGAVFIGVIAPAVFRANYDLAMSAVFLAVMALAATWEQGPSARLIWSGALIVLAYAAHLQQKSIEQDAIAQLRGFYGCLRVTETHFPPDAETTRTLFHGSIQHGTQMFGGGWRMRPANYYARNSGVGLALDLCCGARRRRIGVVGLGTGTLAAYGRPGDEFVFYEIDPLVERLARGLFTYLRETPATVRVVTGDARISLAREKGGPRYDVLVLDAFSGDAVPVHLLTAEALRLYLSRLNADGVVAFHISSQYLDLAPELDLEAKRAGLSAVAVHTDANEARGEFATDWVLMTRDATFLRIPEIANASGPLESRPGLRLWTDDYSSVLPLLKWSSPSGDAGRYDSGKR